MSEGIRFQRCGTYKRKSQLRSMKGITMCIMENIGQTQDCEQAQEK